MTPWIETEPELEPLPPMPEWRPLALPPETERRVRALHDRVTIWHAVHNHYVRSRQFGLPQPKGFDLKCHVEMMRRINRELDAIVPPDAAELARRDLEFARQRELAPVLATFRKNQAMAKELLGDIVVEPRYARLARNATDFAARRLAPHRKPPRIRFFHPDGKAMGRFKHAEPDWIHIADGLSDEGLVVVCAHEVSHWATADGGSETIARYDEAWIAREYIADHGRVTHRGWEATA